MVSTSSAASSLSYADRAKLGKSPSSSQSPTPSSTSTTDVEKPGDDAVNGLNGLSLPHATTPNFWAARKEQMAAKVVVPPAASSSSSPTLAGSPPLLPSAPPRGIQDVNGVDLSDTSSWPQVAAASIPSKDKSDKALSKDPATPTPTPKKSEKKKWVPIPATELQAAADAVTRGHSSPKHASGATSTHSSPKTSSRGRRLPNEEGSHDNRRSSPSRLATHAYTHAFNSPTQPATSFTLPPASRPEPHHPPLTRQKRPVTPARSGPVAGYRDIDDLKLGEGRLVMFGSIGAPSTSLDNSPAHRGLGLDVGATERNTGKGEETVDVGRRVGRGFAIGIAPDEFARTKMAKAARRTSAPVSMALAPEIVDLTDGAWLQNIITSANNEENGEHERKWEFGTSRHPADTISTSPLPSHPQPLPQTYVLPPPPPPPQPHLGVYPQPLAPPMTVSAPESVVGDHIEYDGRQLGYGEPYVLGMERERRGGYGGPGRRGRYAGGRGGPNGTGGRGYNGRRGGGGPQHYGLPPPGAYPPPAPYPPPPPPGVDGYYMGNPYGMPYPHYLPPPVPPYPAPPVMDASAPMRPTPVPIPVTITTFPVDPTRFYLLGQVEYYFSVQNLCTDFWLRQQMDSRGWVPISVIASFNRIRHLTYDVGLVRDVMGLSELVEVQGDKVRLRDRQWVPFILPDAPVSDVPEPPEPLHPPQPYVGEVVPVVPPLHEEGNRGEEEAEEEEEVVFVLGKESEERRPESWTQNQREETEHYSQS